MNAAALKLLQRVRDVNATGRRYTPDGRDTTAARRSNGLLPALVEAGALVLLQAQRHPHKPQGYAVPDLVSKV
jgi:hypothetical protein